MKTAGTTIKKILRNFFRWIKSKEFLVFLFFLLISGFFWGVLAVKEPTERELVIPIKLNNIPKNVLITDIGYDSLKVTVRDNGYNLIGYDLSPIDAIQVNFVAHSKSDDGKISVSNSELIKLIRAKIERSTEIVSVKPDRLEIYYNYGDFKVVPVKINGDIRADDKYFLTMKRVKPDSVKIYATTSLLSQIDSINTSFFTISNAMGEVTKNVRLQKINGVKLEPEVVRVEAFADVRMSVSLDVPIQVENLPEDVILKTFPSKVSVEFVTGSSLKETLTPADFRVVVDYNEVEKGTGQKTLTLKLVSYPHSAKRPKMAISKVDYLIERK